jgi:hypothetical protein
MPGSMLRCATANVKVQYAGPIATALHTALGRSRPVARGSISRCEAAKQAILVAHRWLPAAQPGQHRCHRRGATVAAARLLSEVMVEAGERRARCRHLIPNRACG